MGLTATPAYTPFGGVFKRFSGRIWRIFGSEVPAGLIFYSASLALAAIGTAAGLVASDWGLGNFGVVLGLGLVAAYAERGSVRLTETTEVSISLVPTLFAAVLFGPLAGMLVAAISNIVDLRPHTELFYLKWVTYTASRALTAAAAAFAAAGVGAAVSAGVGRICAATAAGAIVAATLDAVVAAVTHRVRGNGRALAILKTEIPLVLMAVPVYAPIVALLVVAYDQVSPLTLPLFMVPALAAQRLHSLYQAQRSLTNDVVSAKERLERANLSFASALVATLDARDRYTAGHSAAVAIYSRDIAERMGLSSHEQQLAHLCGLVHDIGKVGLPPGLLEKPGALSLDERRQMEEHAAIGQRILAKVEDYAEIATIVRHHHERVDGQGYPDGLRADEIPVISRIIAVADAYNAMTSDRPYREAMPSQVARLRLAQAVESQFDTSVVAAFEAILTAAPEGYRRGLRAEFTFDVREDRLEDRHPIGLRAERLVAVS